jgi:hypothetical protein
MVINFQYIAYIFISVIALYSLILWIKHIRRKQIVKILRKKYPYGFIYNGDKFLSGSSKTELPVLDESDKSLFIAIGISNFVLEEPFKIDWSDYEYTCYF